MRLWTIQPVEFYENLSKNGYIICNKEPEDLQFKEAYDWMGEQMDNMGITHPEGIKYPLWAWYIYDWKNKKPDLRKAEFCEKGAKAVCIEIEVPDNEVCLSDYDNWHGVLNKWYIDDSTTEEEYDNIHKWYDSLEPVERRRLMLESWQKVFNFEPFKNEWVTTGRYVQATFWELNISQVKNVKYFTCR